MIGCGLIKPNRRPSGSVSVGRAITRSNLSSHSLFVILESAGILPSLSHVFLAKECPEGKSNRSDPHTPEKTRSNLMLTRQRENVIRKVKR